MEPVRPKSDCSKVEWSRKISFSVSRLLSTLVAKLQFSVDAKPSKVRVDSRAGTLLPQGMRVHDTNSCNAKADPGHYSLQSPDDFIEIVRGLDQGLETVLSKFETFKSNKWPCISSRNS